MPTGTGRTWRILALVLIPGALVGFGVGGGFQSEPRDGPLEVTATDSRPGVGTGMPGAVTTAPPTSLPPISAPPTTAPSTTAVPTTVMATDTTSAPLRPRDAFTVMVLDGSEAGGRGREVSGKLREAGFYVLEPSDRPEPADASAVFWADGFEGEARAVVGELGLPPSSAKPLAELASPPEVRQFDVAVLIGRDLPSG